MGSGKVGTRDRMPCKPSAVLHWQRSQNERYVASSTDQIVYSKRHYSGKGRKHKNSYVQVPPPPPPAKTKPVLYVVSYKANAKKVEKVRFKGDIILFLMMALNCEKPMQKDTM